MVHHLIRTDCRFHRRILPSLVALALTAVSCSALAVACTQLDGMRLTEWENKLAPLSTVAAPDVAQHVDMLRTVYGRIAQAAGIQPAFLLCKEPPIINAFAIGEPQRGLIIFTAPMVRFINGNQDEAAAVMGHEIAHVLLNHTGQNRSAAENLGRWANKVAVDQYRRTGNIQAAIDKAKKAYATEAARFSRSQEREADDKGFSLAFTVAKFNGEGAKNFARKLSKLPPSDSPPYLDTHPGWLERFDKADALNRNQQYLGRAAPLLRSGDWTALNTLVEQWLREIPTSGAGWYYKGRALAHQRSSKTDITKVYESSLSNYLDNPVLGVRSQEDQVELDDAWYFLCLALFDEGFRYESASCSRHIVSADKRDAFQARTFGDHQLYVGGSEPPTGNLIAARSGSGGKLITNDMALAASRGNYNYISPTWKAIRFPDQLPR